MAAAATSWLISRGARAQVVQQVREVAPSAADGTPSIRRIALVIGVDVGKSKFATNGARHVAAKLQAMGYEVEAAENPGRARLLTLVEQFGHKAEKADLSLLFFGGHGIQVDQTNYLVPHGVGLVARPEQLEELTVSTKQVFDALRKAPLSAHVIVLDACRQNPFPGLALPDGLAEPANPPHGRTFIAYAAAPGSLSSDGDPDTGSSFYADALVANLATPGGRVEDVFKKTRRDMGGVTQAQKPWDNSALLNDVLLHDEVRVEVAIEGGDDEVLVAVAGRVFAHNNPSLRTGSVRLPPGDTPLTIYVFNQHTFVGHNAWFGNPEGWHYRVKLTRPDGRLLGRFAAQEAIPEKDGPRHGQTFEVARMTLRVDPVDRKVGLVDVDTERWKTAPKEPDSGA